jgi:hypothetical protein
MLTVTQAVELLVPADDMEIWFCGRTRSLAVVRACRRRGVLLVSSSGGGERFE